MRRLHNAERVLNTRVVQRVREMPGMRHTAPHLTTGIYGCLDVEDMRAGLDRLRIATQSPPPPTASIAAGLVRRWCGVVRHTKKQARPPQKTPRKNRALDLSGRQDLN